MRWNHLFDDLETQLERELAAQDGDLEVDNERLRLGRLSLRERLLALHETEAAVIQLTLTTGGRITLRPTSFGQDWFSAELIGGPIRRPQCIVPLAAIAAISLAPGQLAASLRSAPDARAVASASLALGLPFVLRDLCRRRRPLDLVVGLTTLHGTIDRVGHDHLDLAVHEPGSERRPVHVTELRIVPLTSIALVRF